MLTPIKESDFQKHRTGSGLAIYVLVRYLSLAVKDPRPGEVKRRAHLAIVSFFHTRERKHLTFHY